MLSEKTNSLLYNSISTPIAKNDSEFSKYRNKIISEFDLKSSSKIPRIKKCVWLKISHGENLVSRDSNNLSDPYCKIKTENCNKTYKTSIKYKTLQPVWNEVFVIPIRNAETLEIQVFDSDKEVDKDERGAEEKTQDSGKFFNLKAAMKDALLDGDDFMGKTTISVNSMTTRKQNGKLDLKNKKGIIKCNYGNLFVEYKIISAYRKLFKNG